MDALHEFLYFYLAAGHTRLVKEIAKFESITGIPYTEAELQKLTVGIQNSLNITLPAGIAVAGPDPLEEELAVICEDMHCSYLSSTLKDEAVYNVYGKVSGGGHYYYIHIPLNLGHHPTIYDGPSMDKVTLHF